jgi:hypothetical protein
MHRKWAFALINMYFSKSKTRYILTAGSRQRVPTSFYGTNTKELNMKKLALAICACAFAAIAAPTFADDLTPATDAATAATATTTDAATAATTDGTKKANHHKKHAKKKAQQEVAKQDVATSATDATQPTTETN